MTRRQRIAKAISYFLDNGKFPTKQQRREWDAFDEARKKLYESNYSRAMNKAQNELIEKLYDNKRVIKMLSEDVLLPTIGIDLASRPDKFAVSILEDRSKFVWESPPLRPASRPGLESILVASRDAPLKVEKLWMDQFSAFRPSDREVLVMVFETIARGHGARTEQRVMEPVRGFGGAGIHLTIKLNDLEAEIMIATHHSGAYAPFYWHRDVFAQGIMDFSAQFLADVRAASRRQPYHAASYGETWFDLAHILDRALKLVLRGAAFEPATS